MAYSVEPLPRARRSAPTGQVAAGRPSQHQCLRLERSDTSSAHLILAADHQMNGSRLIKSHELVHRHCGLGPQHRGPIPPVFY
jgi:hypothetical protein